MKHQLSSEASWDTAQVHYLYSYTGDKGERDWKRKYPRMNIHSSPRFNIEAVFSQAICKGRGLRGSQADAYFYTLHVGNKPL